MAQEITVDNRQLGFGSIKIYPDECLGTGAYGAVYKAMCDELPCAAKLLHSSLFQFNDPGMPAMIRRFQQECELMGKIRHPCIIQYLGTVQDPESRRPILLMELMDESLTKFLESSTAPLAYHLQVNLSYDVALALAYLHSNGVIHRDLSSNNVLITAGSRAKVTDFGMLKLLEQNMRMTPLTKCPGTVAYMPPEALSDEPEYTDKLDCFSLGVLMIQMITRNFPKPTKSTVTVRDPKYPTGRILIPIPEVERRKSDIDSIEPQNCLRSIALDCIKDTEKERLSAKDVCQQLLHLKSGEQYSESIQKRAKISSSTEASEEVQRLRREIRVLNEEKDKEIGDLRQQLFEKDGEIEDLKRQLCVQVIFDIMYVFTILLL
jgi:serine/threonine protein kinase